MNNKKIFLIKLGGSLITDKNKPYTAKCDVIKQLASEIREILKTGKNDLVIGHGGGSFPHVPAKLYQIQKGFVNDESAYGMSLVQDSAAQLNRILVKKFLEAKIRAFSINPSSSLITENGKITEWYLNPLEKILKNKMLPVVYGDVVVDLKNGCSILSTEVLLNYLALNLKKEYQIEKIIYLGDTDGVWDENKKTISEINLKMYLEMQKSFGASKGIDVTGGMEHKMSEAMKIVKQGFEVVVANGKTKGILQKIINNEKGNYTTIKK